MPSDAVYASRLLKLPVLAVDGDTIGRVENLVLVPRYGIAAAAWATVGCQALLAVLLARTLRIGRVAATSESTQSNEQNLDHAEHRGPGARDAGPGNDVRTVLPLLDGVHEGV